MKLDPWSDCMALGRPTSVKNFVKALIIVFALMFYSGIASGNRVEAHIMVSIY